MARPVAAGRTKRHTPPAGVGENIVGTLLVSAQWLVAHHTDPDVVVLDPRRAEDYDKGHVPGARSTNTPFKDPSAPLHVMTAPQAEAAFRELGISNDTNVVVMGDGMLSGRLWFVLRLHGHTRTRLADGGFAAYVAAGGPVSTERPKVRPGTFTARRDESVMCRADEIVRELGGPTRILDVRSIAEWQGSNTMDHKRVGHIPGARHLLWTELLTEKELWLFRSPEEIRAIAAKRGAAPGDRVITVCEVGWRASHTAFALRLAGFEDVRVYDASMREWDNREDLPSSRPRRPAERAPQQARYLSTKCPETVRSTKATPTDDERRTRAVKVVPGST